MTLFYKIKELFFISKIHLANIDKPHLCPGCWSVCWNKKYRRRIVPWRCSPCGDIIIRLVR